MPAAAAGSNGSDTAVNLAAGPSSHSGDTPLPIAPRAFGFLAECGYETVAEEPGRFVWTSAELGVEVAYDSHERRVVTVLDAFIGDRHARASLACLYVETGCGPAQDVREN